MYNTTINFVIIFLHLLLDQCFFYTSGEFLLYFYGVSCIFLQQVNS
jgi:hypothetical protein